MESVLTSSAPNNFYGDEQRAKRSRKILIMALAVAAVACAVIAGVILSQKSSERPSCLMKAGNSLHLLILQNQPDPCDRLFQMEL